MEGFRVRCPLALVLISGRHAEDRSISGVSLLKLLRLCSRVSGVSFKLQLLGCIVYLAVHNWNVRVRVTKNKTIKHQFVE